jgi:hypothetical protein
MKNVINQDPRAPRADAGLLAPAPSRSRPPAGTKVDAGTDQDAAVIADDSGATEAIRVDMSGQSLGRNPGKPRFQLVRTNGEPLSPAEVATLVANTRENRPGPKLRLPDVLALRAKGWALMEQADKLERFGIEMGLIAPRPIDDL